MRDEALEHGFAGRDGAAYEAAYRSFRSRMYTTALRLLRDPESARECVHDVFLHLWHRGAAYSASRGSLEAFLVTCARNQALMRIRSRRRTAEMNTELQSPGEYVMEDDPIERDRIARALAQLTEGQAVVVQRAYYGGMTLTEVATDLGIPVGTVKTRLSAALAALRRSLMPEAGNGI